MILGQRSPVLSALKWPELAIEIIQFALKDPVKTICEGLKKHNGIINSNVMCDLWIQNMFVIDVWYPWIKAHSVALIIQL